jgi:cytochrome P450
MSAPLPPKALQRYPGQFLNALRSNELAFTYGLHQRYGDAVRYRAGPGRICLLTHPDAVEQVLVSKNRDFHKEPFYAVLRAVLGDGLLTTEDEVHKRQRRLIQPIFHHTMIKEYGRTMVENASRHRQRWRDGESVDMHEEMMRLTLAIVGKTLFGAEVEDDSRDVAEAVAAILGMLDEFLLVLLLFYAGRHPDRVERLPIPALRRFHQARDRLDAVIYRLIEERKRADDGTDLVSRLLEAQEDGRGMSVQQVRNEAMTLFLAGHETTAVALTWTFCLLARHPDVEEKLHAELEEVLGDRLPEPDDVRELRYTRKVLSESMRLFPPVTGIGRQAIRDVEVGGWALPKGTIVSLSQYSVHRDPRWYPEPRRFDPERWEPDEDAKRPRYSYFPFGGGPRLCIGEPFAWMEGILLVATIAQHWQFDLAPGYPMGLDPKITLRPKGGMRMTARRRS